MNKYLLSTIFGVTLLFFAFATAEEHKTENTQTANNDSLESQIEKVKETSQRRKPAETIKDVALQLEEKRNALNERELSLNEYEKRIKEREQALDVKIKELQTLRDAINVKVEEKRKDNEERVIKLVNVIETMNPKSASGVMETLEDSLAVEVLKKMSNVKMAKLMNIMDKARSAKLSELMTGYDKNLQAGQAVTAKSKVEPKTERTPAQAVKTEPAMPKAEAPSTAEASPAAKAPSDQKKGG